MPPPNILHEPRSVPVTTTAYVDASHVANKVTRRSYTGFIIFLNRSPITWFKIVVYAVVRHCLLVIVEGAAGPEVSECTVQRVYALFYTDDIPHASTQL